MNLSPQPKNDAETDRSRHILWETLVILGLTVIPSLLWPSVKVISVFLPIAYLLIERRLRTNDPESVGRKERLDFVSWMNKALGD